MKKLLFLLLFCGVSAAHATVYTVNNNIPSPGQFTSVNTAIAAASAGDTIYITGSPYNYNSFTIDKKLTIIGTGWEPRTTNTTYSLVDNIDFSDGAAATGSAIIGLCVYQININQVITGLVIARNKILYRIVFTSNTSNLTIEGNWFSSGGNTNIFESGYIYGYYIINLYFRNNVVDGTLYISYSSGATHYNLYINNNLFLGNGTSDQFGNMDGVNINNNIFYGRSPSGNVTNSAFRNSISFGNMDNAFGGSGTTVIDNQVGVDPLFVDAAIGDYSTDNNYQLQSSSPAKDAGTDGDDIGLSGGEGYFETHGVPGIPQMNDLQIVSPEDGQVLPGGTIQVSLFSTIQR